ncbi:MAG: hypothetical protein ACI4MM_10665 [Candidatus Ventricola sp.]
MKAAYLAVEDRFPNGLDMNEPVSIPLANACCLRTGFSCMPTFIKYK